MDDRPRIRAKAASADAVLPGARAGCLGVVMLDTRFPRPPGDVGHPATFACPVRQRVVRGAFPREVVTSAAALRASPLLPAFVAALRSLAREGAAVLTTSCGFLVLLQAELQAAVRVPVVSSSLLLLPQLLGVHRRVGVLTIDVGSLGEAHLLAAGVPPARLQDVVVQGVDPQGEFASAILGNRVEMAYAHAQADVVGAALALQARAPDLQAVVLECTNMPPFAPAVRRATGWQVLDLRDAVALHLRR